MQCRRLRRLGATRGTFWAPSMVAIGVVSALVSAPMMASTSRSSTRCRAARAARMGVAFGVFKDQFDLCEWIAVSRKGDAVAKVFAVLGCPRGDDADFVACSLRGWRLGTGTGEAGRLGMRIWRASAANCPFGWWSRKRVRCLLPVSRSPSLMCQCALPKAMASSMRARLKSVFKFSISLSVSFSPPDSWPRRSAARALVRMSARLVRTRAYCVAAL